MPGPTTPSCFPVTTATACWSASTSPSAPDSGDLRTSLEPLGFDKDVFVEWAAAHVTERPPNYVEIIKANMGRSDLAQSTLEQLELGPNRCSV